jgi:hypothetical protein
MLIDRRRPPDPERGAVVVLFAVLLPVLGLLAMFAIDTAHWWDYSRNLQSRADAAALAAGLQYGNTCGTSTPDATAMAKIGEAAQLYSGPGPTSDLPYAYATPPTHFAPTGYQNLPTLKAGTLDRYHVFINAPGHWASGQTSAPPTGQSFKNGSVCAASYPDDQGGKIGPITDIWVTQDNVPQFFKLVDIHPSISAHARVEIQQGVASDVVRPIAVRDSSTGALPSCVSVNFVKDDTNHTLIKTVTLTKTGTSGSAVLWDNSGAPAALPMPTENVIVQAVLGCGSDATTYDDSTNSGLLYVNSYGAATPSSGQAPLITTGGVLPVSAGKGGVFLDGSCISDQYFSTQDCVVSVTANVAFASGIPYSSESVKAVDTSSGASVALSRLSTNVNSNPGGSDSTFISGKKLTVDSTVGFAASGNIEINGVSYAYSSLANNNKDFNMASSGTVPDRAVVTQVGDNRWTSGLSPLTVPTQDGRHPIRIDWEQRSGTVGGNPCTVAAPCTGSFGMQQQAFGACSACDAPDDSGPIVAMRLRQAGTPVGSSGANVFANTATPSLVIEIAFQSLTFDVPNPSTPAQILRVGTSTDKGTGLIDCGQGSGANADADAIVYGCPLVNTGACKTFELCAPFEVYDPSLHTSKCDPMLRNTPDPPYTDCVEAISGTRRAKIPGAIADRIIQNGTCGANNWPAYASNPKANPIPGGDPRAVLMVITAPADLTKNSLVPIKNFATFYVTGWDTSGSIPNCSPPGTNEAFPGAGKTSQSGAIWGHWIVYTDPNVVGNGTFCDPTQFGVCASVLTR